MLLAVRTSSYGCTWEVPAALPPAPENVELPPNPPEANVEPE